MKKLFIHEFFDEEIGIELLLIEDVDHLVLIAQPILRM